jgi:hypothetical protein
MQAACQPSIALPESGCLAEFEDEILPPAATSSSETQGNDERIMSHVRQNNAVRPSAFYGKNAKNYQVGENFALLK